MSDMLPLEILKSIDKSLREGVEVFGGAVLCANNKRIV